MRKNLSKIFLGVFMLSFIVACGDNKDKKADAPKDDTATKVEAPPPMPPDTAQVMDKDTADTRPVKPGE